MSEPRGAIAAIVVAHDSGAVLARCVSLLAAATGIEELIVVDNASRDGAAAALAATYPAVRVIRNADNRGYAVACNQGAAASRAPWLAFVNPDCFVGPDTLVRMVAVAAADATIGLVGADIRDAGGAREAPARRADPTLVRVIGHYAAWLGVPARARLYLEPSGSAIEAVDAVSGALIVMPRAVYDALGGFDEAFRLHAEDLDLCRRVRAAGWRVVVAAAVEATHLKGSSSQGRPWFVAWHKHRGIARYWRRHGAGGGAVGTALAIAAVWIHFVLCAPGYALAALRARYGAAAAARPPLGS